ncbi:MAG TPA: hypothetical protein VFE46_16355 [Pirellulales bacterium]|jgi:hypothetical protein|nr:hypothetical protein [Pirellulales bacterium]
MVMAFCLGKLAICSAADDSQAFVEALCARQYLDTATDYLQSAVVNPHLAADFKASIPYEQAIILSASSNRAADLQSRISERKQACAKLREFIAANPDHELAGQARDRLGTALMELADTELAHSTGNQSALLSQAHADYAEGRIVFEESAKRMRNELDKLPPGDQREELGGQWLGAAVNVGRAIFSMAITAEPGSQQQKNLLQETVAQCGSLYKKFPSRLGGGVAHFYEARANEELGEQKLALSAYSDLIDELSNTDTTVRPLKTQAILRAQAYWLQDQNFNTLIDKTLFWARSARGAELVDPNWLMVKLGTATALEKIAATLPKNDSRLSGYMREARNLVTEVVNSKNSDLQNQAQNLLAQLTQISDSTTSTRHLSLRSAGGNAPHEVLQLAADARSTSATPQSTPESEAEITSFDPAYDKASEATEDVKSVQVELEFARQESVPDAKHIAELEATLREKREEAFKFSQRAIALTNSATNLEKVNQVRYWLCYFNFSKGNYYDAAVLGDFLARKYPKSASALPGAEVALAAFDALYRQQKQTANNLNFEIAHLSGLANYVIGRWPDDIEAASALQLLISLAIDAGDYDKAKAIIARAPADSAARRSGEANLGQALWSKYLRTVQQLRERKATTEESTAQATTGMDDAQTKHNLDALLQQAKEALEQGVNGMRKQEAVDERAVLPALSLARLYLNVGDANKALELLEDPKIGPLTMLRKHSTVTQTEEVAAEIYKTALHAYIAVAPQQLDNAVDTMNSLEKLYANDKDSAERSMQTLVDIAVGLQQKLDELNNRGETEKAQVTSKAFDTFLNKISQRESTADYKILNWVAATYESLANGLNPGSPIDTAHSPAAEYQTLPKLSPDAQNYLQKAINAYELILSKSKENPDFMPAEKVPAIQRRLALNYRTLGNYGKSIAMFAAILKEKPSLLSVQVEAAYTYQMGGKNNLPDDYVAAILGGRGPTESIWGWNKIAQKTARDERFRDNFHEARYNMALCRVEFSATRKNDDEKRKLLELAKDTIRETKRFESTLGGSKWQPQYEKLLREIQKDLGEPVVGLLEFEPKNADTGAKDTKN